MRFILGAWKVCERSVESAWEVRRRYTEGARKVCRRCVEGAWKLRKVHRKYVESVQKVIGTKKSRFYVN